MTKSVQHKRILILGDEIGKPAFNPRLRTLCDELIKQNYDIIVFTEQTDQRLDFHNNYLIIPIHYYHMKGNLGKLEWAYKFFANLIFDHKNRFFTKRIRKQLKQTNQIFDLVFCTSFHTFPQPASAKIAKSLHIPYFADVRDLAEQMNGNFYNKHGNQHNGLIQSIYKKIQIKRRNEALKKACAISTVSPWHQQFLSSINTNTHLIYNGFDASIFKPEIIKTNKFIIRYAGRLYDETMQDPTLLYEALSRLASMNNAFTQKVKLEWFTNKKSHKRLQLSAQKYHVERMQACYDYIPPDQVPKILNEASIVLVLSNKATINGPHGIMTTKFFEALGCERPVLCVRSDESCLADAINRTNAGLAGTNVEEVEKFLLEKFHEWQINGFTLQPVNKQIKKQFSRQAEAEQFLQLFSKL